MLTEKFFSPEDLAEYEATSRKLKKVLFTAMGIVLVILITIWTLLVVRRGNSLLPFAIGSIVFFTAFELWIIARMQKLGRKDMNEQIKLAGEVTVLSKKLISNNLTIKLDDNDVKEIIVEKKLYDKINEGDRLYLELSKYRKQLFKVSRDGVDLK